MPCKKLKARFARYAVQLFIVAPDKHMKSMTMNYFQPDLARSYGYPLEEHFVQTIDGYNLTLHRIPSIGYLNQTKKRPIVLLAHPLMSSSAVFTYGPINNSLAYLLADEGKMPQKFQDV